MVVVRDDCHEMITFFDISGAMICLDNAGQQIGYEDVFSKIEMCRRHYDDVGLGRITWTSLSVDGFAKFAAGAAADYTARTGDGIPPLTAAAWLMMPTRSTPFEMGRWRGRRFIRTTPTLTLSSP
jgi:hypothetical protein